MISVINPSQYGAFSRSSGVVAYPEFYPYHMTNIGTAAVTESTSSSTATSRQSSLLDPMSRVSSTSSACQFVSSASSSRSYFPNTSSPGSTRL